jgi:ubiquinone/menaquinone biosynthesis C-methylase UbiE
MPLDLPIRVRSLSDEAWLQLLHRSVDEAVIDGIAFPRFPSPQQQANFVGSAYQNALQEAYSFYSLFRGYAAALGSPIARDTRLLDFGCGWGRFLRFFWKDVAVANLHGCDVNSAILEICRQTAVPGELSKIAPGGSLPYADGSFDAVMAYSVFTHLPEQEHRIWMEEFKRVVRPGGVVAMTLEPRRFLDFIESIPAQADSPWHQGLRRFAPQIPELRARFDSGEVAYLPTGGGEELDASHYGDALVPLSYIEKNWGPEFQVRDYIDDPNRFWQAVLILQKV